MTLLSTVLNILKANHAIRSNTMVSLSGGMRLLHQVTKTPLVVTVRTQTRTTVREMRGKSDSGRISGLGYLLLTIPGLTFCLGCWQVKRRKWKLNLIKELQEKTQAPPIAFPKKLSDLQSLEYRRVRVEGEFDHTRELYVQPRSPVTQQESVGKLVGGKSPSGACVVTPFKVAGSDLTILVNRGWVPKDKVNPKTRKEGQVPGPVHLVGVVRKPEKRSAFATANNPAKNQWFYKDSDQMAEVLGTEPIMLDADGDSTVPGGPLGGQTRVTLRNEHLSYIFTWYTLSVLTSYSWYRLHWLKK